jgi:putative ABC transport system ATP-binding protein
MAQPQSSTGQSRMMLLSSHSLRIVRKEAAPLSFPDLALAAGSRTLLLGPSGCGKTTLLTVLAGLLPPRDGRILFDGTDIYSLPARRRDHLRGMRMGFVFQSLHLVPYLSVEKNMTLAAAMPGLSCDPDRINNLLHRLGLSTKKHSLPRTLSQGEQQRAAIARALINRPAIVFADEPTAALDDDNAESVIKLLHETAADSGAALLIATHDRRLMPHFDDVIKLALPAREEAA